MGGTKRFHESTLMACVITHYSTCKLACATYQAMSGDKVAEELTKEIIILCRSAVRRFCILIQIFATSLNFWGNKFHAIYRNHEIHNFMALKGAILPSQIGSFELGLVVNPNNLGLCPSTSMQEER